MTMKPFLIEEVHDDGHVTARIVWGETFDEPEIHATHGTVLDIVAGEVIVNVDDLGSNTAEELAAAYGWLIDRARVQHGRLNPVLPEIDFEGGQPLPAPAEEDAIDDEAKRA